MIAKHCIGMRTISPLKKGLKSKLDIVLKYTNANRASINKDMYLRLMVSISVESKMYKKLEINHLHPCVLAVHNDYWTIDLS